MEEYYLILKKWSLDSNQWSILIGGIGVCLTFIGFAIAYHIYKKQRKDNSQDAFDFFQSSLPDLRIAISETIENLEEFIKNLENDEFSNPLLSASLNDKFFNKINSVDLNRFYSNNRENKHSTFRDFLNDANFFGDYHSYFTNEINYFRNQYLEKERIYSKWQLLRSNKFFSSMADENEPDDYKKFYGNWVTKLNQDLDVFKKDSNGKPSKVESRRLLVANHIENLAENIFPFIPFSEKANEINLIANEICSSYADITSMKMSVERVMKKDIEKFKKILIRLDKIIE